MRQPERRQPQETRSSASGSSRSRQTRGGFSRAERKPFGTLVANDPDERARRAQRLGVIEATFDPLPVDAPVAREWGRLAAAVAERGGRPRKRAIDLVIAATANVHGVPLLTADVADFAIIEDLVHVQASR
jgi:predicted nucleic acid-binding protein